MRYNHSCLKSPSGRHIGTRDSPLHCESGKDDGACTGLRQSCGLREQLEQHHEACYGWALRCCQRRVQEAEDVLQDVYLQVLDGRARYAGNASLKTWLFAVIRRTAAYQRRRRFLQHMGLVKYERREVAGSPLQPSQVLERRRLKSSFDSALMKLPGRQREILHLVFYSDLTIQEAADVLSISVGSARQHYERGKARLKAMMEQFGEF